MMDKERLEKIKEYVKYRQGDFPNDIRWLISTVEEQQKEIELLKDMFYECPDCGFEYHKRHEDDTPEGGYTCPACEEIRLENENTRLREALEFYGNQNNYLWNVVTGAHETKAIQDSGYRARQALVGESK